MSTHKGSSSSQSQHGDSNQETPTIDWEHLRAMAPYPKQAFAFVQEGLAFTTRHVHGDPSKSEHEDRHVSGQQLCEGLRDYAIKRYGLMARSVLNHWRIERTDDFGRIVFALIDIGAMSRTDRDCLDDFYSVYSFEDAFSNQRVIESLGHN
ncbi:MAG: hypothetical protein D8M59_03615 [Planctomycetes bacterium]|nr:hypothetical protein [Planctomycetota bacterium]NOG53085.1 hypothetical protein [Planctomycetota bacterium]